MTSRARAIGNYGLIALLLIGCWLVSFALRPLLHSSLVSGEQGVLTLAFFEMIVVLFFGYLATELSKPTVIPSFVLAIVIGMLERESLSVVVQNGTVLTILTTLGAALILFGGGLDTPFALFKKLIGPILSIAFLGTILTALGFTFGISLAGTWLGMTIPVGAAVVVGAALASTDPAAIIPSLSQLIFKNPRVKHIAVSESAINDVVGAVLTGVFLTIVTTKPEGITTIGSAYVHLLGMETIMEVLLELAVGMAIGYFGFVVLKLWSAFIAKRGDQGQADAALFLAVPLTCYLLATALHGSGFLAVFVSSLLFYIEEHNRHVEHYFVHTIEGFMKPMIFMLLGAAVDPMSLMQVAPLGIAMGALFMFVIRPIAVFLTVGPFAWSKHKITLRELLFLSFVRETGVIPAVLLIGLRASGIPGAETAVAVGLWVILLTLIVQPPLTPFLAKALGLIAPNSALPGDIKEEVAVLCSRGRSFVKRLPIVAEWAGKHGVHMVVVLHCLEDNYTDAAAEKMQKVAEQSFKELTKERSKENAKTVHFRLVARRGMLEENIAEFLKSSPVAMVFVGNKMLDYRLSEVKALSAPFTFLD